METHVKMYLKIVQINLNHQFQIHHFWGNTLNARQTEQNMKSPRA